MSRPSVGKPEKTHGHPVKPVDYRFDPSYYSERPELRYVPVNTLGLPFDVNPGNFYQYRASMLGEKSVGFEHLLYSIFGSSFIGSTALALDPLAPFKRNTVQISPWTRFRTRMSQPAAPLTHYSATRTIGFHNNVSGLNHDETLIYSGSTSNGTFLRGSQPFVLWKSWDTTAKSRSPKADFGESEFFRPYIAGSGFSHTYVPTDSLGVTTISGYRQISGTITRRNVRAPFGYALWTTAKIDAMLTNEQTYSTAVMQQKVLGMISRAFPTSRRFSLYREIAELKDLPQTLRGSFNLLLRMMKASKSLSSLYKLKKLSDLPDVIKTLRREAKEAGDTHLNFQFGWGPMLKDLQALLDLPSKVSKKVNRLIERNGRDTRWGSIIKFVDTYPPPSAPSWATPTGYAQKHSDVSAFREVELRLALNARVTFPLVRPPILKEQLLDEIWGSNPCLVDLYDLIPWTWLIGWFSDLDDYVHVMSTINDDRALINYGFLTYNSHVRIIAGRQLETTSTTTRIIEGVTSSHVAKSQLTNESILGCKYSKRRDVATTYGVPNTQDLTSLRPDQEAILGALVLKYT